MNVLKMTDLDLAGKRVLMRLDLNVPIEDGRVMSDARIEAALPSIKHALNAGAKLMIMSHLGRPEEGKVDEYYSLGPVALHLENLLGQDVLLELDYLNGLDMADGEVVLFENIRFNVGEKANDDTLSKKLAALCDIFVMDAFGTAHRAQASTHGVAQFAPTACAGPLLVAELEALGNALETPAKPLIAVVGGSKVSTKLTVLDSLSDKVDELILGGGILNTFIRAAGHNVGASLHEPDLLPEAGRIIEKMKARGAEVPIPQDVVVGKKFDRHAEHTLRRVEEVEDDDMILDIGPYAAQDFREFARKAGTIVWNGPLGVFEFEQFGNGTRTLALAVAHSHAFSIAGGGDTLAAIDRYGIRDKVSYVSTGGGAFLEFLEGKTLPAVAILEARAA